MLAGIFLPTAWAAEFTHVQLARVLTAYQGSAEPPDPGYQAYAFRALAFHTPDDAEVNASLTLPDSGPSYFLDPGWVIGSLEIRDELYFGPEDVDAVWPDGVYGISLEPAAGVTQPASVELAPAAYPPVPVVANYNDLATLNPGDPFTISWLPFAGAGAGDCIQVEVYSWGLESWVYRSAEPGTAEAISPVASSLELPAETFQPLDSYSIFITFHKVHVNDTAQIPGTRLTVARSASTECWVDIGETVEMDTQAPWLVSVDPASGSKAAADTPVIFTFDEPMQPGVSIEWKTLPSGGEVTYEWNTEQTVLTCLPSGTWATGQRVRWTLNPSAVSLLFADVAGNFLSPDVNTGSFTIAAATYGTAPAEWLPGPFTVIEPDGSGAASLKVAAESLRGHMVQKSADLKNWQTIQTITSEVSLMEIPLSDLAPGEPAFFRLAQFAAPLSIAAEEDATVSQLVLPAGGTISTTGPDGTFYELVVPPGALTYPVEISLTPLAAVAGLPLSGGLVAGVQLQPDGLEFLQPATLRMRPTGGINLEAFTGFSAEVDGVNLTWEPWIFENGTDVLLQVTHFSTVGGANGTDAEQAAKPPACDPLGRLKETVANYLKLYTKYAQAGNPTVAQYYMDEAHRVVIEYYTNVIMPQMVAAKTNDALVRCAVKDLVAVVSMGRSIGEDSPVLDLNPPEMKEAIRNAGLMAYQRCAENGDLREMANIMSILAQDQLLGTLAFSAGEFQDMTQGCLRFKLDFRSEVGYDGWMYAGHHVLEAKDIVMEPTIGDGLSFNAKGPL
ncbi:MAG TPA: Ig-like domain-containing protein, partial [Oceanipulchritudo sp.]|nr:Ig-like domain-containing protein [Oceanipulchritudo sp.]